MANVQYQPQEGQLQLSVPEQQALDWSMVVNGMFVDGALRNRPGWQILKAPATYSAVADNSSPDGFAYSPATWSVAADNHVWPLGSYLFAGTNGDDWILEIIKVDGYPLNFWRIHTSSGQVVGSSLLTPQVLGVPISTGGGLWRADPDDVAYCFARWADTVFFCNGGYLWRWEPLKRTAPDLVSAFHNPQNVGAGVYATSFVVGASIVAVHQDCLVVGGFAPDTTLIMDGVIDVNGDGITSSDDLTKSGGYALAPDKKGVVLSPFTVMASDPGMPNCFQLSGIYNVPSRAAVSAFTSHTGKLIVWSNVEMSQILGPIFISSQLSYQPISNGIGCVGKRAHCQTCDGDVYFLSDTNVYAWNGSGLPVIVSSQINELFRAGAQPFYRWDFVAESPNLGDVTGLPFRVVTRQSDECSMVWNSTDSYVAMAVTSGTKRESNDLVMCYAPDKKQWWFDSVEPTKAAWIYASAFDPPYWVQDPASCVPAMAAVGRYTLMTSDNEPGVIWAQCMAFPDYWPTTSPSTFLCVNRGGTDDQYSGFGNTVPTTGRYAMLCVSAPVFLGDSDEKLQRRLSLRTMGIRRGDYPLSYVTNKLKLYVIPENGHSDVIDSTDTTSAASEQEISTWRDSQGAAAYWQDPFNPAVAAGVFGGTAYPVGYQQSWIKRWYPLAPVDRRIDIPSRVLRWFRIGISRVFEIQDCSPVIFLSTSVDVVGGYGVRRG